MSPKREESNVGSWFKHQGKILPGHLRRNNEPILLQIGPKLSQHSRPFPSTRPYLGITVEEDIHGQGDAQV